METHSRPHPTAVPSPHANAAHLHPRPTQVGAATLLHRPATLGLRGMVLDYLLLAVGTRQLLPAVFSGLLMHPPLAVAAQQALHVLLTGSARDYCRRAACRTLPWGCCFAVHAVHAVRAVCGVRRLQAGSAV